MKEKIKKFLQSPFAVPAALALLILLAYGILTPRMGFYWDDLPFAWFRPREGSFLTGLGQALVQFFR